MARPAEGMAPLPTGRPTLAGALLAAWLGATLAGCATAPIRAPVEDRSLATPPATSPIAREPPAAAPTSTYTVRRNDTLYSIAWRHQLDYKALAQANGIEPPYTIYPGGRLRLPAAGLAAAAPAPVAAAAEPPAPAASVRRTPERAAPPPPRSKPVRRRPSATPAPVVRPVAPPPAAPKPPARRATDRAVPKPRPPRPAKPPPSAPATVAGWRQPVAARPVRAFGGASKGLDYALPSATKVRAAAPGVVVYAGPGLGGYRHLVIVKASERYLVAYGINVPPQMREGDTVAAGATVAEVGGSGAAGKFHFEIRDRGKPVDPRPLVGSA